MKYYHYYTHKSGMKVLLIQNEFSLFNGVSMSIDGGVNKEPPNIYGLAHFTEHMMFLGSKKHPKPSTFVDYVTTNEGRFNGFTEFEKTSFFYKINKNNFEESFDIFSSVFISPNFDEKYIQKEVNSVNSEYERNVQLDSRRKDLIIRDIANPNSLFHKFSTGNKDTLNITNLRDRVIEFFNSTYIPKNMFLVVYGPQSIKEQKKLVEKSFEELNRRNNDNCVISLNEPSFVKNSIGKLILYETINVHQDLDIRFYIDNIISTLPDNFGLYYQILFNYKGKGSIGDIMTKKGYATSIFATLMKTTSQFSFFLVKAQLTSKGITHLEDVLSIIFSYINRLKEKSIEKKLYKYIRKSTRLNFFFNRYKQPIMTMIRNLSSRLFQYKLKYLFVGNSVLGKYNKQKLIEFGKQLNINNSIIVVGNKSFPESKKTYSNLIEDYHSSFDKHEKYFFGNYSLFNIKKTFIKMINKVQRKISFPTLNIQKRMPRDINLVNRCMKEEKESKKECVKILQEDKYSLQPTRLNITNHYHNVNMNSYYKRDRSFLFDKSNLYLKFVLNYPPYDIKYASCLRLYIFALFHRLRNSFYEESLRGNSFQIITNANGFTLKLFSFSSNLRELTLNTLEQMKNLNLTENNFITARDDMLIQLQSQTNLEPLSTAYVTFFNLLKKSNISQKDLVNYLQKELTFEQFNSFCNEMYNSINLVTFIHGAIPKKNAIQINRDILKIFGKDGKYKNIDKSIVYPSNKVYDLQGKKYVFRINKKHNYNINNGVMNFYQIGVNNYENFIKTKLIKLICGYIYFKELRIKQQLGYVAKGNIFQANGKVYYLIKVQGSKKDPDVMNKRIDSLLLKMKERVLNVTNAQLKNYKKNIERSLKRKAKSMKQRSNKIWDNILNNDFSDEEEAYNQIEEVIDSINKDELISFFDEKFLNKKKRGKLSIQVYKKRSHLNRRKEDTNDEIVITDINFFRKHLQ